MKKKITEKQIDKLLDKVIDKAINDLDNSMNNIESSKDWKILSDNHISLSIICSVLIKHLSMNLCSMQDMKFVKKQLKNTLSWVAEINLHKAKQDKKNATLN
jgi:hypothetical protein